MNIDFEFWNLAFKRKAIDEATLKQVVKTESNPFGEITLEEYKTICNKEFIE